MQISKEFNQRYPNIRYGYPDTIAITFEGKENVRNVVEAIELADKFWNSKSTIPLLHRILVEGKIPCFCLIRDDVRLKHGYGSAWYVSEGEVYDVSARKIFIRAKDADVADCDYLDMVDFDAIGKEVFLDIKEAEKVLEQKRREEQDNE